jgi:LPXTG-motif cell wall-anchored protein
MASQENRRFGRPFKAAFVASALLATPVVGVAATALPAAAQTAVTIDPDDFIDPITGEFDVEAYLAALAALANQGDGGGTAAQPTTTDGLLPYTGSSGGDLIAGGVAVLVAGGAAVAISRRRRPGLPEAATVNASVSD